MTVIFLNVCVMFKLLKINFIVHTFSFTRTTDCKILFYCVFSTCKKSILISYFSICSIKHVTNLILTEVPKTVNL